MKVVQITTSSKGGAGIASLRLHHALRESGVSSAYLSKDLSINFNGDIVEDEFFSYQKPSFLNRLWIKLQRIFSPSRKQRFMDFFAKEKNHLSYEMISWPFSNKRLEEHRFVQEADLVNLHMVTGVLDYESFFSTIKKPVVWTLHDMNPFSGIFHYQGDEDRNIAVKELNSEIRSIKHNALAACTMAGVVSPSAWLLQTASESKAFDGFLEKQVIANGIDLSVFKPNTGKLRKQLGIGEAEKVLLFAAGSLHLERKGFSILLEALSRITFPLTILTLGKGTVESPNKAVKIIPLGFISEPQEIAACYGASDACILPSLEDNLPNTMLESLATGTPIICFKKGGMKEHVKNNFNGILANEVSEQGLLQAIETFFDNLQKFNPNEIRKYAEENFSMELQSKAYQKIYTKLMGSKS